MAKSPCFSLNKNIEFNKNENGKSQKFENEKSHTVLER